MSSVLSGTILRNTFSGYTVFVTRVVISFLLTPFVIGQLGVADYGLWLLVLSVTGYFNLMDFGFGQAITRYVAMKQATGGREHLNQLASTFIVVYLGIGLLIAVLTVVLGLFLPRIFHIAESQASAGQIALLITGFAAAINFPMSLFGGWLLGFQRYDLANATDWVSMLANTVLTLVVLGLHLGLIALVIVAAATGIMSGLARVFMARWVDSGLEIRLHHFRREKIREITTYSVYFFIVSTAVLICHGSDQIVIGLFLPTTAVAIYGVNLRLVETSRNLAGQLSYVLLPVAAGLHALADTTRLQQVLMEGTRLSLALIVGLAVELIVLSPPFLRLWVGAQFLDGYVALVVLTIVAVAAIGQDTAAKVLMVTNKQRVVAGVSVIDSATNLGLSLLLVQTLGIVGVALGTAIPFLLVASFNVVLACRSLKLPLRDFWNASLLPALLPSVPSFLILWGLSNWTYPSDWVSLLWQGAAGGTAYAAVFLAIGVSNRDRQYLFAVVQQRVGSLRVAKG